MPRPAHNQTKSAKRHSSVSVGMRAFIWGAILGSAATVGLPTGVNEFIRYQRDKEPSRDILLTVSEVYGARPGQPMQVVADNGDVFEIGAIPQRGNFNAVAAAQLIRPGCSYAATAHGFTARGADIKTVMTAAVHIPTQACARIG